MLTLSHGVKKPQTGDKGSIFFPALEANMQILNDHTHNGTDSEQLNSNSVAWLYSTILAANWSLVSLGVYRQAISMPSGLLYANKKIVFKDSTTGDEYQLSTEKITTTSYYVYTNDNTISLIAYYL